MVKRRKSTGRKTIKRTSAKGVARYVVNATFKLRSAAVTKTQADKIAREAKAKGGTTTIRKV